MTHNISFEDEIRQTCLIHPLYLDTWSPSGTIDGINFLETKEGV